MRRKQTGSALLTSLALFMLLSVAAVTYVNSATLAFRNANRTRMNLQTTNLCEAGLQDEMRALWVTFKVQQNFTNIDNLCMTATANSPGATINGNLPGVGRYSAGVIAWEQPISDSYTRNLVIRSVGWLDYDNDGVLDNNEPRKVVDSTASYKLTRSQVFDYTYFVNNYGWMNGFDPNELIVNGDMRANGNFDFSNGSPTVNGSIYAAINQKLTPAAIGEVNTAPVKWANNTYNTNNGNNPRTRQAYNAAIHGAPGTALYESWRDFIFETDGSIVGDRASGAVLADSNGYKSWSRTNVNQPGNKTLLDNTTTDEVVMPDLSDLTYYQNLSTSYVDQKATYGDGTANPAYGQGAYVQVWDPALNGGNGAYKTISTNGVVNGSAALIGTQAKPIKIHGPVTFAQDAVIKGYVSGQGTIYTGRNVHIVGSIRYSNPPDFRGSNMTTIDNANEKKDMIALAARGSVIMGNPSTFTTSYPLQYMTPPFTKGRYDDNGNWIPPFDANQIDATGKKKYQSAMGDAYLNTIAESVSSIDAILYTNFVGGGNIATGGGGITFNGSIISKDEAMVVYSLPMTMNYDNRIRERSLNQKPLIDLFLPRSPVMLRSSWKDRGFKFAVQ